MFFHVFFYTKQQRYQTSLSPANGAAHTVVFCRLVGHHKIQMWARLSSWNLKVSGWLVGGFSPTHLKNMFVKLDMFPKCRGENQKNNWNHHLDGVKTMVTLPETNSRSTWKWMFQLGGPAYFQVLLVLVSGSVPRWVLPCFMWMIQDQLSRKTIDQLTKDVEHTVMVLVEHYPSKWYQLVKS